MFGRLYAMSTHHRLTAILKTALVMVPKALDGPLMPAMMMNRGGHWQ